MKIAIIADTFSLTILKMQPDVQWVILHPLYWRLQLSFQKVDLLFVESAWMGKNGQWRHKIASYPNKQQDNVLLKLTKYCKKNKIPSVFWSKEDPVHFSRFINSAKLFDHVLTTEQTLLDQYKAASTEIKSVQLQTIFFQPLLHNPTVGQLNNTLSDQIVFCGGLYKKEFPDRAERLIKVTQTFDKNELTIFDRFNNDPTNTNSWSSVKNINCLPSFNFLESKSIYQSAIAHINVNSCDDSSSMYSRRLIELLACGAKVINITQHKKQTPFNNYVLSANSIKEIREAKELPKPQIDFDYLLQNHSIHNFINRLETLA
ncbi:MAG: hypothetical protein HRU38_14605 [Saccharospirillaceae bacterium]|nr:hypothetical protein [Pseudomonadales bacterium]NRB79873.1 hypothetical protein [Saccharospirillaceae bacterium]